MNERREVRSELRAPRLVALHQGACSHLTKIKFLQEYIANGINTLYVLQIHNYRMVAVYCRFVLSSHTNCYLTLFHRCSRLKEVQVIYGRA